MGRQLDILSAVIPCPSICSSLKRCFCCLVPLFFTSVPFFLPCCCFLFLSMLFRAVTCRLSSHPVGSLSLRITTLSLEKVFTPSPPFSLGHFERSCHWGGCVVTPWGTRSARWTHGLCLPGEMWRIMAWYFHAGALQALSLLTGRGKWAVWAPGAAGGRGGFSRCRGWEDLSRCDFHWRFQRTQKDVFSLQERPC